MADLILNINDDGKNFTMSLRDRLIINLEQLGGAGFDWEKDENKNADKDKIVSAFFQDESPPNTTVSWGAVGESGVKTYIFKPRKKGTVQIKLKHRRPWEADAPPLNEFGVTIRIE